MENTTSLRSGKYGNTLWRVGLGDAYLLLTWLLAQERAILSPPELARREGGKPFFPALPGLCFNVSHSSGLALCVLSGQEVGADIEWVRPRRGGLPRYVLSEREFTWYENRGGRWEDFYTLWTLKEARVKCTGEGLVRRPDTIVVPCLDPGGEEILDGFHFLSLAGKNWRGAVCKKTDEPSPKTPRRV